MSRLLIFLDSGFRRNDEIVHRFQYDRLLALWLVGRAWAAKYALAQTFYSYRKSRFVFTESWFSFGPFRHWNYLELPVYNKPPGP